MLKADFYLKKSVNKKEQSFVVFYIQNMDKVIKKFVALGTISKIARILKF